MTDNRPPPKGSKAVPCPACGNLFSATKDSRNVTNYTRRRRACCRCGHRFTTHEVLFTGDEDAPILSTKDLLRNILSGMLQLVEASA